MRNDDKIDQKKFLAETFIFLFNIIIINNINKFYLECNSFSKKLILVLKKSVPIHPIYPLYLKKLEPTHESMVKKIELSERK